jgi:hypothetical protein
MTGSQIDQGLTGDPDYQQLLGRISEVYRTGQNRAFQAANRHLTETYWQIGHDIVEYEQGGQVRAEYGKELLSNLSRDLKRLQGRGGSRSNLVYMRLLYVNYPISQKPSDLLSWSHYVELLRVSDPLERGFYEQQTIREKWSVPSCKRFTRLAYPNVGQVVRGGNNDVRCAIAGFAVR